MNKYNVYILLGWVLIGGCIVVGYHFGVGKALDYLKDVLFSVGLIGFSISQIKYKGAIEIHLRELEAEKKKYKYYRDQTSVTVTPDKIIYYGDLPGKIKSIESNVLRIEKCLNLYEKAQRQLERSVVIWGILLLAITIISFFVNIKK